MYISETMADIIVIMAVSVVLNHGAGSYNVVVIKEKYDICLILKD